MQFQAQQADNQPPSNQDASSDRPQPKWELPNFELTQITAFGSPAVVNAPSYKMLAQAERIELQLSHNRLLLQDTEQAVLRYDGHTFRAPRMRYFVDPQGGPGSAEVSGGGQYIGTLAQDVVQLHWRNELRFGPRDGKYLLEADGNAHIQWGKKTGDPGESLGLPAASTTPDNGPLPYQLAAGQLQVWMRKQQPLEPTELPPVAHAADEPGFQLNPPHSSPLPAQATEAIPNTDPNTGEPAARPPATDFNGLATGWRPDRFVARTNVQLRTPQLVADVEYAEVELRAAENPFSVSGDDDQRAGPALIGPRGPQPTSENPPEQYQLIGHEVRIALQEGNDGEIRGFESIRIQGGVHLRQVTPNADDTALEIKGSLVALNQSPSQSGVMGHVAGEPASVRTGGVELTSPAIFMDQPQNRVWTEEAGSAFIPLPKQFTLRFARRTATLSWQGSMNFDGESVTCDKGVKIIGPAQIATADALRATLAQPIRLDSLDKRQRPTSDPSGRSGTPEQVLAEISLTGNVWLENRSFDDQGLASIDEFRLRSLTFNQSTGQLLGDGPGWISSLRYTQQRGSSLVRTPRTNEASRPAAQLTHSVIEFQKQLNGNLAKREVSVHDRVRAIHGPVSDWQQRIRFDDPERSPETIVMRAMRLTVAQMSIGGGQPTLEFAASGNTEIEGRTFMARAQHVRYAQAKDKLVMEGDGRSVVQLSYQSRIGAPRNNAAARKIQYWIHENRLNGEGFVFGDMTGPIASQPTPLPNQPNAASGQITPPRPGPLWGRFSPPAGAKP
jgi:lipopolysaccharide export system protein LptA